MLLVDTAHRIGLTPRILVLQTGRLHQETLDLLALAQQRYRRLTWDVRQPNAADLQGYIDRYGVDGFRASVEAERPAVRFAKSIF